MLAIDRRRLGRELLFQLFKDLNFTPGQVVAPWRAYSLDEEGANILKQYLHEALPGTDASLIEDFQRQNCEKAPLSSIFGEIPWPVSEVPGAAYFSAPGFSSDGMHAMIASGVHFGSFAASGATYLYKRVGPEWVRLFEVLRWLA
jgi:hypothetical protein